MKKTCVVFLLVLLSCGGGNTGVRATDVRIEGARGQLVIHAEVADSDVLRARGLMNRTSLAADRGMLFLWTDTAVRRFYMKDTLIPLDLISIRARRVVGVTTMQPCHIADCPTTKTPAADAALEVPAGTAKRAGISAGALVTYQLPN